MSDGPHRGLNMRRGWKRLADRAGNAAFDDTERSEALAAALEGDCRTEVPKGFAGRLRHLLDDPQGELFDESVIERLEALRGDTRGRPLAGTLLDCVTQAVHQGLRGTEALTKAASDALRERAASSWRQAEEHCRRTSSAQNAKCASDRIEHAIAVSDMDAIATRCMGLDGDAAMRAPLKKSGIDDGVSLS